MDLSLNCCRIKKNIPQLFFAVYMKHGRIEQHDNEALTSEK